MYGFLHRPRRALRAGTEQFGTIDRVVVALTSTLLALAGVMVPAIATPSAAAATPGKSFPTWTHVMPAQSPSASSEGLAAFDQATGQLVLFTDENGETWSWDGSTWTQLSPAVSPPARTHASMAYDSSTGQLLLFGGYSGGTASRDTWTWNGNTWTQLSPATSPPGRYDASMAYDPGTGQLLLFGGYSGAAFLNDTWTWNGINWTQLSPGMSPSARAPAVSPPGRYIASMDYDPGTGQLVLFGGVTSGGTAYDDTWTWNGNTWAQRFPSQSPTARSGATMAFDQGTGQLVLFGGNDNSGNPLNDTWIGSPALTPDSPLSMTAASSSGQASLNWSAPSSDGGSPISGYNVYEGTSPGGEGSTPVNSSPLPASPTSYTVSGLANDTTYYFIVRAINAVGVGDSSNEVSAGTYTLSVAKSGTGSGTITSTPAGINCGTSCSASYALGSSVTLTETPASGTTFTGWSGPCTGMASTTCTVTMNSTQSVSAAFTASSKLYQQTSATFSGPWAPANCPCFSGGSDKYSTAAGASATFTFTGKLIQFVSEQSPIRGSFKVYIDGALKATVSDYSTTTQNAVVVWQQGFATSGKHTLKIVNAGTAGHPRVDVDAFVVGT